MKIVKIDIDGVIRNIFDSMCEIYNNVFNENIKVDDIFEYDVDLSFPEIKKRLGISASNYFFELWGTRIFLESNPYEMVKESIEKLKNNGYKIVLVTWQYTFDNKLNTIKFLEYNSIPYDDICFTKDKWMIKGDWIIDDNIDFIMDSNEKSNKILIDMPYNKKENGDFYRAKNLFEAVDKIIKT